MPSFEQARQQILDKVSALRAERVELAGAAGRVLAEEIVSGADLPPFDNSAMDGFALRSADCASPARLKITGYVPAGGLAEKAVEPGCAIRIMTGAPVPEGSDAVVPVEETEESGGEVQIAAAVRAGQHIRRRGEDVARGERVLAAGTVLHPPAIGILASLGQREVEVFSRPQVAILSTGDELVELGEAVGPGKIVNSNSVALAAALRSMGAIPVMLGIAGDDPDETRVKLSEGLAVADALITTAGVSAGDRDFVPEVLEGLGVQTVFREVAIKPGGPAGFGLKDGKPVFSLPGNPVSALVVFETLVRPAILKMMGHSRVLPVTLRARLEHEVKKKAGKLFWLRVSLERREGEWLARSAGDQNTGIQTTLLRADGLAMLDAAATRIAAGEVVEVHPLWGEEHRTEVSTVEASLRQT